MYCLPNGAKYPFYLSPAHGLIQADEWHQTVDDVSVSCSIPNDCQSQYSNNAISLCGTPEGLR